jgi:hypothetical protein
MWQPVPARDWLGTCSALAILALAARAGELSHLVTFNREILPILQKNCQACHRPGQAAPMSFLTYESTRPWARAIKLAVLTGKMPPWSADSRYGHFRNEPTLTHDEVETLTAWVDGGASEGDPHDRPAPLEWTESWKIPPDTVVSMPQPVAVPARGTVELTDIVVPSGFKNDTWVTSIEIRPGNRSVVHHVIVSVVPHRHGVQYGVPHTQPQNRDVAGVATKRIMPADRLRGLVGVEAVYVPGAPPMDYRPYHAAKLIPAGSDVLIQVHYTPNGTATTDQTQIGFTLTKEVPERRFLTVGPTALRDQANFRIPAGDPDWATRTEVVFGADADLVWFLPHMHLRGKDMMYRLTCPDGRSRTLLSIKWDFKWQMAYESAEPIPVPKGAKLEVKAHFDNSANNRLNPDPTRDVWWGDQTWEEMMVPWFGVIVDKRQDPTTVVTYTPEFSGCGPSVGKRLRNACRKAGIRP